MLQEISREHRGSARERTARSHSASTHAWGVTGGDGGVAGRRSTSRCGQRIGKEDRSAPEASFSR